MQNPSLDASVRKTATRAGELADVAFGICAHTADLLGAFELGRNSKISSFGHSSSQFFVRKKLGGYSSFFHARRQKARVLTRQLGAGTVAIVRIKNARVIFGVMLVSTRAFCPRQEKNYCSIEISS